MGTHHGEAALLLLGDGALAQEAGDYDKSTRPDEDAGGGGEGAGGQDAEVATSLHQGPDAHGQDSCPPRPAGDHQVGAGGGGGLRSCHSLSARWVPGTSHALSYSIQASYEPVRTVWWPSFTDEEMEAERGLQACPRSHM